MANAVHFPINTYTLGDSTLKAMIWRWKCSVHGRTMLVDNSSRLSSKYSLPGHAVGLWRWPGPTCRRPSTARLMEPGLATASYKIQKSTFSLSPSFLSLSLSLAELCELLGLQCRSRHSPDTSCPTPTQIFIPAPIITSMLTLALDLILFRTPLEHVFQQNLRYLS